MGAQFKIGFIDFNYLSCGGCIAAWRAGLLEVLSRASISLEPGQRAPDELASGQRHKALALVY